MIPWIAITTPDAGSLGGVVWSAVAISFGACNFVLGAWTFRNWNLHERASDRIRRDPKLKRRSRRQAILLFGILLPGIPSRLLATSGPLELQIIGIALTLVLGVGVAASSVAYVVWTRRIGGEEAA